jgi:hypothetical protein
MAKRLRGTPEFKPSQKPCNSRGKLTDFRRTIFLLEELFFWEFLALKIDLGRIRAQL